MNSTIDKIYDSIEFQVEENLSKPTRFLNKTTSKAIFNEIFVQTKENSYFTTLTEEGFKNEKRNFIDEIQTIRKRLFMSYGDPSKNVPMEILTYELDTENKAFYNDEKVSLISGLVQAYANHYPIVIFPDMIWMLILQAFSRFLDKNHELVREKIVNFQGKKELCIRRNNMNPSTATKEDWKDIFNEFIKQIGQYIGEENLKILSSDFSTTNPCTLTTSQVSIMTGMRHYFKYTVNMCSCGISQIELQGSLDDWKKILEKTKSLEKFGLEWWTKEIIPIIEQIIFTKEYYTSHNCINSEIKEFWKKFIKVKFGSVYDPDVINGWIVKFFPDIENKKVLEKINKNGVKDQILSCPMKLNVFFDGGLKKEYECSIESGFFGMDQDNNTYKVRPILGYALVVVDKKES